MTLSRIAISFGNGALSRSSRSGGLNMAPASGRRVGMSKEPLAWFKRYGKIRIRTERRAENYEALVKLAACFICHRNL